MRPCLETLISSNDSRTQCVQGRPSTRENLKQNKPWCPKTWVWFFSKPHNHCVILGRLPTELSAMFIWKTKVVVPSWPSFQGCNKSLIRCCKSNSITCCNALISLLAERWIRAADLLCWQTLLVSCRASQSGFADSWIGGLQFCRPLLAQGWDRQGEESKPQGLTLEGGTDVTVASFLQMEPGTFPF